MLSDLTRKIVKNGVYIHLIHALLHQFTDDVYISSIVAMKLYSVNYFYWYGHLYTYLPNPRHNWVKQFIRFTDTGHIASVLPLIFPGSLPIAHNIHFVIMMGYWLGKVVFNMKDADRIDNLGSLDMIEWHMDACTYIHHTLPYLLILYRWSIERNYNVINCYYEHRTETVLYSYLWLYAWFFGIYIPWRIYTGDTVYSILDLNQTSVISSIGFMAFIHLLFYMSNSIGLVACDYITR